MKKFVKIIVILSLIVLVLILGFVLFIKYNQHTQQVIVLSYHNIISDDVEKNADEYETLTVSEFEKQMQYLKDNGYTTISADELYRWKNKEIEIPEKSVLITFDDGYYSFKYLVQPVLEKYDFKAICFVIGNTVGEATPAFDANVLVNIGKDEIYNHIENVEYGSHTYDMHHLTKNGVAYVRTFSRDDLKNDVESFSKIFNAEYLAYPYYTYTADFINVLKGYNYKLAFAGEEEMATRGVDNYKIPRISGAKSFEEFKNIFETDKYRNKYGNGLIRKICVNIERRLK